MKYAEMTSCKLGTTIGIKIPKKLLVSSDTQSSNKEVIQIIQQMV